MTKQISFSTISLAIISFILLIVAGTTHADWYPQDTGDVEEAFRGITALSEEELAVVGEAGTIYTSSDGGLNWTVVASGIETDLYAIDAADETRLFAVGAQGAILRSTDKGTSWAEQVSPAEEDLTAIDMETANIGTAVGSSGIAITTGNSGLTWTERETPIQTNLNGVSHVSNSLIWAVGDAGTLLKSSDQGVTWEKRGIATAENLNDIIFLTDSHGFIVGDNGTLFQTMDNGGVWTQVDIGTTQHLHAIDMFDEENALIVGDAEIFITFDTGASWMQEPHVNTDPIFYDVAYFNLDASWAVGVDANGGFVDRFDSTVPTAPGNLAIDGGSPTSDATPRFTWDASSDPVNEIDHYVIEIGSNSWTTASTNFEVPVLLADGEYTVYVYAEDEAGNAGATAWLDFVISGGNEIPEGVETNTLIKLSCDDGADVNDPCKAVYYFGSDNARHAFPNEKVFFTWYANFDDVIEVDAELMASLSLGRNVTYRPGVKMVKFITVNTVYAVSGPNILRPIDEEMTAEELYGADWNQQIDDIPDTFFSNYEFGDEIDTAEDYNADDQMEMHQTINDTL